MQDPLRMPGYIPSKEQTVTSPLFYPPLVGPYLLVCLMGSNYVFVPSITSVDDYARVTLLA